MTASLLLVLVLYKDLGCLIYRKGGECGVIKVGDGMKERLKAKHATVIRLYSIPPGGTHKYKAII